MYSVYIIYMCLLTASPAKFFFAIFFSYHFLFFRRDLLAGFLAKFLETREFDSLSLRK